MGDDWPRLAARLGVAFLDGLAPEPAEPGTPPPPPEVFARADALLLGAGTEAILVAAPRGPKRRAAAELIAAHPELLPRVAVARPAEIRRALIATHARALLHRACRGLVETRPEFSATGMPRPAHLLGVLVAALVWFGSSFDVSTPVVALWTLFFLAIGVFRAWIADDAPEARPAPPLAEADLPRFAVLVPLHREVAVVPHLVEALLALDYPADRLDLRIVVEADDEETRRAVARAVAGTPVEAIVVPPAAPRTKPKALNFALATVDAEFVTVFDAEDRPAPDQLRRAAAAFAAGPPDLAVVQAALEIDHADTDRPWLVRQFEIEYAMLFHGLLPWLAHHRLFLPLGGTSNHFRRSVLVEVGGWDPHNVTEDMDIALRLTRAGHVAATIPSFTLEEAPTRWDAWRAQRVRWLKGWLQTWLVHMRSPARLHHDFGPANAVVFHLVMTGQLVSAFLFGPSLVMFALGSLGVLSFYADRGLDGDVVLIAALTAFATGVVGALTLAVRVAGRRRRLRLFDVLTMPIYWCALSVAGFHALVELFVAPGRWNKTSHGHVARLSDDARPPI